MWVNNLEMANKVIIRLAKKIQKLEAEIERLKQVEEIHNLEDEEVINMVTRHMTIGG